MPLPKNWKPKATAGVAPPPPEPDGEPDPYWETTDGTTVRLYLGHVTDVLARLPEKSVHMCVTSPPYWGLRRYLFEGASILKPGMTEEERKYVLSELAKLGVNPE
jgi:hypothetical protein